MSSFHQLVEALNLINEFETTVSKHRRGKGKHYILNNQLNAHNCKRFASYVDPSLPIDTSFAITSIASSFNKIATSILNDNVKVTNNG